MVMAFLKRIFVRREWSTDYIGDGAIGVFKGFELEQRKRIAGTKGPFVYFYKIDLNLKTIVIIFFSELKPAADIMFMTYM